MAILLTDIRILFTNYDIIAYFLNLASCSEHCTSIKHRILATSNINKKKNNLSDCMPLMKYDGLEVIVFSNIFRFEEITSNLISRPLNDTCHSFNRYLIK